MKCAEVAGRGAGGRAAAGRARPGRAAAGLAAAGLMGGRPGAWKTFGLPDSGGLAAAAVGAFAAGGLAAAAVGAFAIGGLASGVLGVAAGTFFAAVLTVFLAGAFLAGALAGAGLAAETAVGRSARPELLKLVRNRSATSASMPLRLDLTWMPIFSSVAMISSAGTPVSFASL